MVHHNSSNEKSYSMLNIVLILFCILMLVYGFIYFKSPETHHKVMQYIGLEDAPNAIQNQAILQEANIYENEPTDISNGSLIDNTTITTPLSSAQITEEMTDEITDKVTGETLLPPLNASDTFVMNTVKEISYTDAINDNIRSQFLIHNSVVFISNFSNGELLTSFSPLMPPASPFAVEKISDKLYMSQLTYQRYDDYSNFIASLSSEKAVSAYRRLQPLINESYAEISRPGESFDDVLNKAINLVLDVPAIEGKIRLTSPSVMYLFNDKYLQGLNDSQKFLLRFGPANLIKIQSKLADIQKHLNTDNKAEQQEEEL